MACPKSNQKVKAEPASLLRAGDSVVFTRSSPDG
nr:MAG TPA: hypothetical protein [Caudoviricetes sp.]